MTPTHTINPVHTCTMQDLAGVHCRACQTENAVRAGQVQAAAVRKDALVRRWAAANLLLRVADIVRVTEQSGRPVDQHLTSQLVHAADAYDTVTTTVRTGHAPPDTRIARYAAANVTGR